VSRQEANVLSAFPSILNRKFLSLLSQLLLGASIHPLLGIIV